MSKSTQKATSQGEMSMPMLSNLKIDIYIIYNSTLKCLNSSDRTAHPRQFSFHCDFKAKASTMMSLCTHPGVGVKRRCAHPPVFIPFHTAKTKNQRHLTYSPRYDTIQKEVILYEQ